MLLIIAHRRSTAGLFLFSLLTLLHICLCFQEKSPKLQLLPPSPPHRHHQHSQQHRFHLHGTIMSRASSTRTRVYLNRHNQSDNNRKSENQQHQQEVVVDQTNNAERSDTTKPALFVEPLDVMLERARKRPISPILKLQAFLDKRIAGVPWLTYGDVGFCLVAMSIGAKGFAMGLLIGKWTLNLATRQGIPPMLVQFYPVLLAIILDQWLS